jgi:hypothetical protein
MPRCGVRGPLPYHALRDRPRLRLPVAPPTNVAGGNARMHGRRALYRRPRRATGGQNGSPTRAQRRAPRAAKTSTCCNGGITAGTAGASSAASAAKRSTGSCSSSMATTSQCACACRATKSARSRRSSWPQFLPMATSLVSMHVHTCPTHERTCAQTRANPQAGQSRLRLAGLTRTSGPFMCAHSALGAL